MPILYVTSFSRDIYEASGSRLLDSFLKSQTKDCMAVFYEDMPAALIRQSHQNLALHDLGASLMLAHWLKTNRDVIPQRLGGDWNGCECLQAEAPRETHRIGCPGIWYNRNASRWFRKVVALWEAIHIAPNATVIWLDADCVVKRAIDEYTIESVFDRAAVFYLKGSHREILDSGILGLHLGRGGREFVEATLARYISGEFRQYPRWDDGYQFQVTLSNRQDIPSVDLAADTCGGDVVRNSVLGTYFEHDRGTHRVVHSLMQ